MRRSGVLPDEDSDEEPSDNDDDDGDVTEAHEDKECVPSLVRDTTMKETAKVRSIGFRRILISIDFETAVELLHNRWMSISIGTHRS